MVRAAEWGTERGKAIQSVESRARNERESAKERENIGFPTSIWLDLWETFVFVCAWISLFFFLWTRIPRNRSMQKCKYLSLILSPESNFSLSLFLSFLIFSLLLYAEWATSAFWVNVWKCINEQRVEPVRSKREKNGLHNFELGLGLVAEYAGVCVSSYVNQKKRNEQVQAILFCRHVDIFECVRFHMRRCEGYMDIYPRTGIQLMAGQGYM